MHAAGVLTWSAVGLSGCGPGLTAPGLLVPEADAEVSGVKLPMKDAAADAEASAPPLKLQTTRDVGPPGATLTVLAATLRFGSESFARPAQVELIALDPFEASQYASIPVRGAIGHIYKIKFNALPYASRRPTFSIDLSQQAGRIGSVVVKPSELGSALTIARAVRGSTDGSQWEWNPISTTQWDSIGTLEVNELELAPNGGSAPGETIMGILLDCGAEGEADCKKSWQMTCASACKAKLGNNCGNQSVCQ